jgi:apolipoprotein N-acyltransferase
MATFPKLWKKVLPEAAGHFARGAGVTVLPFRAPDGKDYRIAPMVCYEDIFPRFGRRLAGLRPHLMINVTNDTWFGDTSEPWQHLALSVFRAVEVRTSMVRAVNTGVSVAVDSTGKITRKTYAVDPKENPRGADRMLAPVALVEGGGTVYAAIGDLPIWLAAFVTFFLWLALPRYRAARARRRK